MQLCVDSGAPGQGSGWVAACHRPASDIPCLCSCPRTVRCCRPASHVLFLPHPQLGTHLRGKKKREELAGVLRKQQKAAHK